MVKQCAASGLYSGLCVLRARRMQCRQKANPGRGGCKTARTCAETAEELAAGLVIGHGFGLIQSVRRIDEG